MEEFTRRKFLARSAMGAGVGLLTGAVAMKDVLAQTESGCSITANFNGTPIAGWRLHLVQQRAQRQGIGPAAANRRLVSCRWPITFTANGTPFVVPVPAATITFDPNLVLATTDFVAGAMVHERALIGPGR